MQSFNDDISEQTYSYDCTRLEIKLEQMKLQTTINHETQVRQQKELFWNLESKLSDLSMKIEIIQQNLFDTIKINTENLKHFIGTEYQPQVSVATSIVDDKILIMIDIKDKLEKYDQILNKIIRNQNDTRQLIKEIDTQALRKTINDNVGFLQKMNEKLKSIEDNSIPKIDQLKLYQNIQQHLSKNYFQNYSTSVLFFNLILFLIF